MPFPSIDRTLRLPAILALVLVAAFLVGRAYVNRDHGFRDYGEQCSTCHHGGAGQARETPPLVGRVNVIASSAEGRSYLIDVLLNGLSGPITANGLPFSWSMPSFRTLNNDEIAAILNWIAQQGASEAAIPPFTAAEIGARRIKTLSSEEVRVERETLDRSRPLP